MNRTPIGFRGRLVDRTSVSISVTPGVPELLSEWVGCIVDVEVKLAPEKTAGQVAYEAHPTQSTWDQIDPKQRQLWETTANAVLHWYAERRHKVVGGM